MLEQVQPHTHNGIDSPKIPAKNLGAFPVYTSAPTHVAPDGTIVIYSDGSTTFRIYVRVNNAWKYVALT